MVRTKQVWYLANIFFFRSLDCGAYIIQVMPLPAVFYVWLKCGSTERSAIVLAAFAVVALS